MTAWTQSEFWIGALNLLVDMGVKGLVPLGVAAIVTLSMRRASAAARHLVWALALGGLLLLPALSVIVPRWQMPILPHPAKLIPQPMQPLPVEHAAETEIPIGEVPASSMADRGTATDAPVADTASPLVARMSAEPVAPWHPSNPEPRYSVPFWLIVGWLAGILIVLSPLVIGLLNIWAMVRKARPFVYGERPERICEITGVLDLHRRVRLLCANPETMPMATGLFRPAIILPEHAETWPEGKLRAVLLHELAHVNRHDCLIHALARVALAVHWFNPLAWVALRRLRIERERACDDKVLLAGSCPSDYAGQLLTLARTLHASPLAATAAITMARRSQLEGRLIAILDENTSRRHVTRRALLATCGLSMLLLCALAPLSMSGTQSTKKANAREARQTVEFFLDAFGKKDVNAVATVVVEPLRQLIKSDWPSQPESLFKTFAKAKITQVLAKQETARVLAGPIADPGKKEQEYVLFVLVLQSDRWLIENMDNMSLEDARKELMEFEATTGFLAESRPSLEFRLVPAGNSPLVDADAVSRYTRQLTTEGPNASRKSGAEYAWFESLVVPPQGAVSARLHERTYILLANNPGAMMDSRSGEWTLNRIRETRSAGIAGGARLTLDEPGAARYRQLAAARVGARIAALIDGQVVSIATAPAAGLDGRDLQLSGGPNGWDNPLRMRLLLRLAELFPEAPGTFIVKQGWNGQTLDVPFPVVVPQWLRDTPEWKEWERRRNMRTFDVRDRSGRRYFIEAACWVGDGFGHSYPVMPRVERYRPDGTLEAQSAHLSGTYPVGVIPDNNYFFAADGKTKTGSLWIRGLGAPGWPFVYDYSAPAADGKIHKYSCTQYGVVRMEQLAEPDSQGVFQGGALVNAIRNYEDARFEADLPCITVPEGKWLATLPSGITIELVAIGPRPAERGSWWRPDGAPIARPSLPANPGDPWNSDKSSTRLISFRISGLNERSTPIILDRWGGSVSTNDKQQSGVEWHVFRTTPPTTGTQPVRLGIAPGPWETIRFINRITEQSEKMTMKANSRSTQMELITVQKPGKTSVRVRHTWPDGRAYRIIAIDLAGNIVTCGGSGTTTRDGINELTADFDRAPDQFMEYQFQAADYQWVEFPRVVMAGPTARPTTEATTSLQQ